MRRRPKIDQDTLAGIRAALRKEFGGLDHEHDERAMRLIERLKQFEGTRDGKDA